MASILGKMCFSFPFDRPAGGTVHLFEAFTSVASFLSFFCPFCYRLMSMKNDNQQLCFRLSSQSNGFRCMLVVCIKNETTELYWGNGVMFVGTCNQLVVETTCALKPAEHGCGGSLSAWAWNQEGNIYLLCSAEWYNKANFGPLDRTSPSGRNDSPGGLEPSLNNAQEHCMLCNCATFLEKLMSFISLVHSVSFFFVSEQACFT